MSRENRICALCREFHTAGHPAEAAQGMGACTGYETPMTVFVPWNGKFCVMFGRAADPQGHRMAFVMKRMDKQQQGEQG